MNQKSKNSATFAGIILLIFALVALYMGYIVLKGVFVPLLFAMIFAVVFYPVYLWLLKKTKSPLLSSFLSSCILVLLALALIAFAVYLAVGEVVSITKVFTQSLDLQSIEFITDQRQLEILVNDTIANLNQIVEQIPFIDTNLSEVIGELLKNIPTALQSVSSYLISFIKIGFDSAAKWIVQLIIFFISFFFLLIDGKTFVAYTFKLLPINALHERQIMKRFSNLCYSWIVVSLLVAFIQGSLAALGFALIGVPSPLIWGIITMFASFIPFIGGSIIWGTIGIIYLILGYYWSALFIMIWGLTMISSSDNVLRPFLLKEGVKIHPLILFLAVLGGFFAFNVPGLVIGPLIVVFISTLLYIYQLEFEEELNQFHYVERKPKKSTEESEE
ncbi:MAG: AI-2E family transporter [Candidatus Altimarinota bacterium]